MRVLLPLAATAICLTACAASRVVPPHVAAELAWDSACYDDIAHLSTELTGEASTDCGLLRTGASRAARSRFHQCVTSAAASGGPFRMGRASVLPDASRCTAAMRAEGGQLWEIYYDFDYDYSDGEGIAFRWILQLSRCESMDLVSASSGYFQLNGCVEDRAMTKKMLVDRKQRSRDESPM